MSRGVTRPLPEQTETDTTRTQSHACPFCEFDTADETAVYVHLQTSHRKSTLAAALLDDAPGRDR
jgi:hypothetical protein